MFCQLDARCGAARHICSGTVSDLALQRETWAQEAPRTSGSEEILFLMIHFTVIRDEYRVAGTGSALWFHRSCLACTPLLCPAASAPSIARSLTAQS